MAKFSGSNATTKRTFGAAPTATSGRALTGNAGVGYGKDDKTALYTLAVTNMVSEPTFYESASDRDNRFKTLVRDVTFADPAWIANFIPFLRNTANMRSASIVVAIEAARAVIEMRNLGEDVDVSVRDLIASACSRADEPAELLGYWLANYGRRMPASIKRGIADAATKLYNERSAIKYDGGSRGIRMGDVLNLTHPSPRDARQSDLFRHLLDRRHGHADGIPESLTIIQETDKVDRTAQSARREMLRAAGADLFSGTAYTWERLSGWLPGGMDAEAWEAIIPSMGYMALLRNLRNFEEAKVSKEVLKQVRDKLEDPDEIAASRQFPFRFFSAYKHSGSTYFASALETGLELSCQNIPEFSGRTLVAIDTSGSMSAPISGKSQVPRVEVAALFGAAVAARSGDCKMIMYADYWKPVKGGVSVLRTIDEINRQVGDVGYGTNSWPSVVAAWNEYGPFDRIIVFTDMQDNPANYHGRPHHNTYYSYSRRGATGLSPVDGNLPEGVPIYSFDLAGYATANIDTGVPGRYVLGGFTDATFRMIPLLEAGRDGKWAWEE